MQGFLLQYGMLMMATRMLYTRGRGNPLGLTMDRSVLLVLLGAILVFCDRSCYVSAFAFSPTAMIPLSSVVLSEARDHVHRSLGSRTILKRIRSRSSESVHRGSTRLYRAIGRPLPLSMVDEALVLTEENVIATIVEAKQELGTLFGDRPENAAVGITGDIEFIALDGPSVVVRLTGRFWHRRSEVLGRVASYVMTRIPECVSFEIEDPSQLEDNDPTFMGNDDHMFV